MLQNTKLDDDELAEQVHIDFCIRSSHLNPVEITAKLETQPSRTWSTGEEYFGKALNPQTKEVYQTKRKRPQGIWAINTKGIVQSQDVEEHIRHLLSILEPKIDKIEYYIKHEDYTVQIHIWWESAIDHGSYEISSEILKRMANLCQHVRFVYLLNMKDLLPD